MSGGVTVNDSALNKKIAQLALFSQTGLLDATKSIAKRFVTLAIKNTAPMILTKSPSQSKKEWIQKRQDHYAKNRRTLKGGWRSNRQNKWVVNKKTKALGRAAAGWMPAARKLNASAPAWVKRHLGEGRFKQNWNGKRVKISVTNSAPYNQSGSKKRADYVRRRVNQGVDGNLKHLKRKFMKTIK